MKTVLLLDIDGVVCNPQEPASQAMRAALIDASFGHDIYFVTGNTFTRSVDLIGWHGFSGMFCNNGDELRDRFGYCVWKDTESKPLPFIDFTMHTGYANNHIEWRSPRFVNYCKVGRFATREMRWMHDASWRDRFIADLLKDYPDIEAVKGGEVSVDIYTKGADKARAAKYLNECNQSFVFIGDKTSIGGNDYPIIKYCEENPQIKNKCFTSNGPNNTLELLQQILGADENQISHPPRTNRSI